MSENRNYHYIAGRCFMCDQGIKPNSLSGTNHVSDMDSIPCNNIDNENNYNLVWDTDDAENFRSELLGKPIYDMKCNKCLSFIGSYHEPSE